MQTQNWFRFFTSAGVFACIAFAQHQAQAVPSVSATLQTSSTITQGEPIVLKYTISNVNGNTAVSVYLGDSSAGFYSMSMSSNEPGISRTVSMLPAVAIPAGGLRIEPVRTIKPGETYTQYVVATEYFRDIPQGSYNIHLHIEMPFAASIDAVRAADEDDQSRYFKAHAILKEPSLIAAHASSSFLSDMDANSLQNADLNLDQQDISIPIQVGPADPAVLRATANQLLTDVTTYQNNQMRNVERDELLAMPGPAASEAWQALVRNNLVWQEEVAFGIKQYPSTQAADLLAGIIDDKNADALTRRQAVESLSFMYDKCESKSTLAEYIQAVAKQRSLRLTSFDEMPRAYD